MTTKTKNQRLPKRIIKMFVGSLKKNTLALEQLKWAIDKNNDKPNDYDKLLALSTSVNEKLDIVHKIRNDIKIYKTINTILTNHYIKITKDQENCIQAKVLKIEQQIKESYENLKMELMKMTSISVANQNISSPIQNSNVILVGNDLKCNQFNQLYIRNEMYNSIIRKIDKLFCGMVSVILIF